MVVEGDKTLVRLAPAQGMPWTPGTRPAMAVWSPTSDTLFYRQGGDVWTWTPAGGSKSYLPGVSWYYPTISPDGHHLAYAVVRADGLHDVYLVDLGAAAPAPRKIGAGRHMPLFLNSSQVWFKTDSQGACGPGADKRRVYDLNDGIESGSVIDYPLSVWPGTSSNF